jgi:hypothetical protein
MGSACLSRVVSWLMPWESVEDIWDAPVEEQSWRETVEKARKGQDELEKAGGSDFYVLCLSELDAVVEFTRPECFVSRAAFVAELRRLMVDSTTPSRPVPSIEGYQRAQRFWLEFMINKHDTAS